MAAVAGGWLWLRGSLPVLDGEVRVAGLEAPVEIVRDAEGVPHIAGRTRADTLFGLGYAHAQDRLWQMEFQRRVAQGRLAEVMGEPAYDIDRLMRTLGIARMAGRIVARLDAETRAGLEAYARGVNAVLAADPTLPVEFQVFGVRPAPWKPEDSMAWLLVMSWDLSGNWRGELARLRYAAKLGVARVNELVPPYPGDPAVPLPDFQALYADLGATAGALLALSPAPEQAIGSNNWALAGRHSETGRPLLANDPHLGLQAPSLWYLAHLASPDGNVVGGTLPGLPFVVLGRNDHLAWAMTTTNGDTQDLFVERLAPDDADSYLTPTGRAKFEVREEVIRVRGEERRLRVRSTRHGPVISDAVKGFGEATPAGHVMAIAWAALSEENATLRAGFAMNRARGRDEFVAALREFHAPQQNIVYADREGRIGFVSPARVPVRDPDNEALGRVPVPGWIAKYDWTGFLPYEELPGAADPASGRVVTANHKVTPPGYRPFISVDWFPPYRANRIEALLDSQPKHSLQSFARMQADARSALAATMLPFALAAQPVTEEGQRARASLEGWSGDTAAASGAPLAFAAWYRELTRLVYEDELGELFREGWEFRLPFMTAVMQGARAHWCDDVRTPEAETCAGLASRAMDRAGAYLAKRHGAPGSWRWGAAHVAAGDHRPFGFFPVLSRLFNVSPETPGDTFSVNVGHYHIRDEARPFANRHAASLRALYDLADLDRSLYMQSTGQSGNILSPWYANLAERWARVEYIAIPAAREKVVARHTLRLVP